MNRIKLSILTILILISGSLFAQKVTVDFDKEADFTKYKTYTFLGWQENIDQIANELDQKRIRDAFLAEMEKRDLKLVESGGDMTIAIYLVIDQRTSTTAYTNYYNGAGMGYMRGGWGWGFGSSTTTYSESDYLQGTMVFNAFDEGSKNLIWQGVATKTINEKPEKREKSIPKSVSKLLKKFPITPVE